MKKSLQIVAGIVVPLVGLGVVWTEVTRSTPRSEDWLELLFIDRRAGSVFDDEKLPGMMAGDQRVAEDVVLAVFCANGDDWLRDRSLDLDVVVATDPALVRAAELYVAAIEDGRRGDAALIADVEHAYWRLGADVDALADWANGLTDDDVAEEVRGYLEERQQPPSAAAADRFVVYAMNPTTFEQEVVYLDTARIDPEMLKRPASEGFDNDLLVAGEEAMRRLDLSDCRDLAERWDRFDPDLPSLPPIEERWKRVSDAI